MKFYANPTSPSPKRVRMFLAEKGLSVEEVLVDTMKGQHLETKFLALNPWATIPVLELDDGTCISEAIACCRYLEEAHPEPPLMGRNPQEKAVIERGGSSINCVERLKFNLTYARRMFCVCLAIFMTLSAFLLFWSTHLEENYTSNLQREGD